MKILLVGDIHFRSKKLNDISDAWTRVLGGAKKAGVNLILQAGDVFDHSNIHTKEAEVGTVYDAFVSPLKDSGIPFFGIPGNHDIGPAKDKDALATIDKYDWVQIVRKPGVFDIGAFFPEIEGLSVCAIPWLYKEHLVYKLSNAGTDQKEAQAKVNKYFSEMMAGLGKQVATHKAQGKAVIMIGHLEITGAKMANGEIQEGGTFEFSAKNLADINADAYGLAHIHVRQSIAGLTRPNDGYLGTLCQLSFGEQGNEPGVRLLEIDNGQIIADDWVINTQSPKYFKVDNLASINYRTGIDYVKLCGDVCPEVLPEGIVFEKKVEVTNRDLSKGCLNCDTSTDELLKKWKEATKCEISLEELIEGAKELLSQVRLPMDSIGSLERINYIKLKNVTSHADTEIKLDKLNGLCSIEGDNGSGKTTTLESILVALYGICPSRPKLPTLISQGCTDEAIIDVGFTSGDIEYRVERTIKDSGKKVTQTANFYQIASGEDGEDEVLAGPKLEEVKKESCIKVGDPELFLAGVFASQGEAGNLLELDPSARKELFAKLLGTDKFLLLAELAHKIAIKQLSEVEAVLAKASRLENESVDQDKDTLRLEAIKESLKELGDSIASKVAAIDASNEELRKIATQNQIGEEQQKTLSALKEKRSKIVEQGREGKTKLQKIKSLGSTSYEAELVEISKAKEELEELRKAANSITEEKSKLVNKQAEIKAEEDKIRADIYANYEVYINELVARNDAKRKEFESRKSNFIEGMSEHKVHVELARRQLAEAEKKAKLIEGFPNESICKKCPLAMDGIQGRDEIPDLKTVLATLEESLSTMQKKLDNAKAPEPEPKKSSAEFDKEGWEKAEAKKAECLELANKAASLVVSDSMKKRAAELKTIIQSEKDILSKVEAVRNSTTEAAVLEGSLRQLAQQVNDIDTEISNIKVPDIISNQHIKAVLETLVSEVNESKSKQQELLKEQGKTEAALESYKLKKAEAEKIRKEISNNEHKAKIMTNLAKAFGRDGIPQIIVDSTIPHFQDLMTQQMADFDGRWSIQVASQKANKDGTMKEVIDIIVDDGTGEREISTYSGGERKLLKSIIRIAFSALMAQRSGKGLKILVLDEATDAMDDEIAGNFIKMLSKLSKMFNQVFVVSHNQRILSTIPNGLQFKRLPGHKTSIYKKGVW